MSSTVYAASGRVASSGGLPPVPLRDTLCRIVAAFNGDLIVTSSQGTWPTWGADLWLLNSEADRRSVLRQWKAAGNTHGVVAQRIVYGGAIQPSPGSPIGYPGGMAGNNDFMDDLAGLYQRLVEMMQEDIWPVLALDGDDGYDQIYNFLPRTWDYLKNRGPLGDITNRLAVMSGYDSIDSIGLTVYQDGGATESKMLAFIRETIGPDAVHVKENWANSPNPWQFPPSEAWSGIDVFFHETQGLMLGNAQAPQIVSGVWNDEHGYIPVYDIPEQAWTVPWQVYRRMSATGIYIPPPDQPFNVPVVVSGGPQHGQVVPVSSDVQSGSVGIYTAGQTPRGKQYNCFGEFGTYAMTHGQGTAAQVGVTRTYGRNMACFDSVC